MSGWHGPPVLVGERTIWLGSGSGLPKPGVVKWIGHLPEIGPDWTVGLELEEALPIGGIDGTWGGRVLFNCRPRHGLLVPIFSIIPGSQLKHLPQVPVVEKRSHADDHKAVGSFSRRLPSPVNQPLIAEDAGPPRPAVRHKRRVPTPPSSDSDEPSGAAIPCQTEPDQVTLRVEEKEQEDSLKKRLRLFTEHNGHSRRMNGHYSESSVEEISIDSLYAQRRQQFVNHGRSRSDSSRGYISSSASTPGKRDRSSSTIFSIFRWFRKESRSDDLDAEFAPSAPPSPQLIRNYNSRCGSVDTLFSTATASSFAFVQPAYYRPFGAANPPEKRIAVAPETDTYRNRLRQRDRIRELDKGLTLKKKYHLFGSGTLHRSADDVSGRYIFHNRLDHIKVNEVSSDSRNSTLGRKKRKAPQPPLIEEVPKENNTLQDDKENANVNANSEIEVLDPVIHRPRHRRTVSDSAKDRKSGVFVHVKGKRKAPPPPINNTEEKANIVLGTQSLGRKKRHAPPPPLEINNEDIDGDTSGSQTNWSPDEKQRLIDNIAKLQAHANRSSILVTTPPSSPNLGNKMPHTVSNDSLKLEKGVLKANKCEIQSPESKPTTPTPVSPRPWYKRNAANKEKSLEKKTKDKSKVDDWMPEVAIARGNLINPEISTLTSASNPSSPQSSNSYRLSNIFSRFEKPEEKRKSQISMLVNISELDREAAEIVQREHEKEKALLAAEDAKYYTTRDEPLPDFSKAEDIESIAIRTKFSDSPSSPKRSGAQELISLFNAIGNVTKVTVNSAFFSKDGPSIFTKEGIEKRFSVNGESVKTTKETVLKENINQTNGYKRETIVIETNESYSESPGAKRRHNLLKQDSQDTDSTEASGPVSPRVVIEEIEESDGEKSKTQAMYEANKIRKHLSPTIPTIVEMSESFSSVTTSPTSTLNASERSTTATPDLVATTSVSLKETVGIPVSNQTNTTTKPESTKVDASLNPQPVKNYSIWSCPRCTLENPRWRVTCEACDMWRPAVRRDVIDKLTNANMGKTIAFNVVKAGQPKTTNLVKSTSQVPQHSKVNIAAIKESNNLAKQKAQEFMKQLVQECSTNNNDASGVSKTKPGTNSKPITVSSLLSQENFTNDEPGVRIDASKSNKISTVLSTNHENTSLSSPVSNNLVNTNPQKGDITLPTSSKIEPLVNNVEMEQVRQARLAFFQRSQSDEKPEEATVSDRTVADSTDTPQLRHDKTDKKGVTKGNNTKVAIDQAKIDALFSIASKGSLATNDEERKKVKEILKEMKNSLPKRNKGENLDSAGPSKDAPKASVIKDNDLNVGSTSTSSSNAARFGAIKKTTTKNKSLIPPSTTKSNNVEGPPNNKAEVCLVKTETVIEEIKVKAPDSNKSSKVSTSVQTSGVIRKSDLKAITTNDEGAKPIVKKPPTPKAQRKDFIVPVTVEDHEIKEDGSIQTTTFKEPRKMGISTFQLMRPRDFANIEVTKTGISGKNPAVHVYANIPSTHNDDSSSSSSSDSPEISQLSAQLTKPKGLADFKASVLEGGVGNKMNTLAVNRLLRQLEAAIVGGEHQRAATLAKELARHKVNCCVTRHKNTDTMPVDLYVEDKVSHQGPFEVQVWRSMTVAQLKRQVERQFELPVAVQRWILGKALASDDNATLQQLGVTRPHHPVFLYLVAPEINQDKVKSVIENEATKASSPPAELSAPTPSTSGAPPPGRGWYYNDQDDRYSYCESEVTDQSSKDTSPEPHAEAEARTVEIVEVDQEVEGQEEIEEAGIAAAAVDISPTNSTGTLTIGWRCEVCTLMNAPTRPGCLACAAPRPADYTVPADYQANTSEQLRITQELHTEQAAAEEKLKNYQELMVLENADLIPSTEAFECSVCLVACEAQEGVVLRDCLHTFCRACLAQAVQFCEDAEVKCPFRDHSYACDSTLQEREIKAVTDTEEDDSCIVCMAEPRCCALTPCGHRAYCETCCLRLIELDHMCSLCRRKADGYLLIYL